jgi:hypothetical protein
LRLLSLRTDQVDGTEQAGGDGGDQVQVLHLELIAVLGDQRCVVVRRQRRPRVERGVIDIDLDVINAGLEQF